MNQKDKLCQQVFVLENEIEFKKQCKIPVRKDKIKLKELYTKLETLRKDDDEQGKARVADSFH